MLTCDLDFLSLFILKQICILRQCLSTRQSGIVGSLSFEWWKKFEFLTVAKKSNQNISKISTKCYPHDYLLLSNWSPLWKIKLISIVVVGYHYSSNAPYTQNCGHHWRLNCIVNDMSRERESERVSFGIKCISHNFFVCMCVCNNDFENDV